MTRLSDWDAHECVSRWPCQNYLSEDLGDSLTVEVRNNLAPQL